MRILLTGFEPFGTSQVNPSERVVRALSGCALPRIDLRTAILPVEGGSGPAALAAALEGARPEAVVCLGQAGGRARLSIERLAVNLRDYPMADNRGAQAIDEPVVTGAPTAYFATLPARHLLAALTQAGIPAELSLSAGSFLCNEVLYHLLHRLAQAGSSAPAGFIHLPYLPEQAASLPTSMPSMALETMVRGIETVLEVLAREPG